MTEGLKGQVAIITGASRGIGLAIAQALAAQDIAVALVERSEATVQAASETIQKMGGRARIAGLRCSGERLLGDSQGDLSVDGPVRLRSPALLSSRSSSSPM
jgi:NAD(P)-dependent dehydrogenase (short-subunit alcohol dehydrogenase family)